MSTKANQFNYTTADNRHNQMGSLSPDPFSPGKQNNFLQ